MLNIGTFQILTLSDAGLYITGHAHGWVPMKLDLLACEQTVNLLQREVARLWVEIVDNG